MGDDITLRIIHAAWKEGFPAIGSLRVISAASGRQASFVFFFPSKIPTLSRTLERNILQASTTKYCKDLRAEIGEDVVL